MHRAVLHSDFLCANLCYFWMLLQQILKLGRSGCQGEKETRRQEIIKRNRRQTFHHSSCGSAAGTAPPAMIFDPGEKQTSAECTGMQVNSLLILFYLNGNSPACILQRFGSIVTISTGDCICEFCVNRNDSAERFPRAFSIPLCSSYVCRYYTISHMCICSQTHSIPACR